MKQSLIILQIFICSSFLGQVFIVDSSFEDTLYCPQGHDLVLSTWYKPNSGTSDTYCPCWTPDSTLGTPSQSKLAIDGDCFIGLFLHRPSAGISDPREYVESKFLIPLDSGTTYCISMFTVLSTTANYAISNIHVGFRQDSGYVNTGGIIAVDTFLTFTNTPVIDSVNWTHLEIEYTASGFENFITIGNFDSVQNMNVYDFNSMTTPPYLQNYSYYFFDLITLEKCLEPTEPPEAHFTIYPNPSIGNTLYIDKYADTIAQISLYNALGQQVGVRNLPAGAYKGAVFEQLASGVYVVVYVTANGYREEKKVVVI